MSEDAQPETPEQSAKRRRPPVIPSRSADDTDLGWGEGDRDRDADILRERPPHW